MVKDAEEKKGGKKSEGKKEEKVPEGKKEEKKPEGRREDKRPGGKKEEVLEEKKEGEIRHRVRVAGVILDGDKKIGMALRGIKGIGPQISKSLPAILGVDRNTKLGDLSEEDLLKVEKTIKNLDKQLPYWMLNRQKDSLTGENTHLIGSDLEMAIGGDITEQKKIRSYKGIRHSLGLPVRGQRTRTSFRQGKTMGVSRKKDKGK